MELRLQTNTIPPTEKVEQFGHDTISTFGIDAQFTEAQRHSVLRQLLATGAVGLHKVMRESGRSFDTLCMSEGVRAMLKDEVPVPLIGSAAAAPRERKRRSPAGTLPPAAAANPDQDAQMRFINLKAWRAEVACGHGLPAYVIFHDATMPRCHDATLAAIAQQCPHTLDDLQGISGMGAKKLEAYGSDVLRVCAQS